jgi:hypothetical protein
VFKNKKYDFSDCFNSKIHGRNTFIHRDWFLNNIHLLMEQFLFSVVAGQHI